MPSNANHRMLQALLPTELVFDRRGYYDRLLCRLFQQPNNSNQNNSNSKNWPQIWLLAMILANGLNHCYLAYRGNGSRMTELEHLAHYDIVSRLSGGSYIFSVVWAIVCPLVLFLWYQMFIAKPDQALVRMLGRVLFGLSGRVDGKISLWGVNSQRRKFLVDPRPVRAIAFRFLPLYALFYVFTWGNVLMLDWSAARRLLVLYHQVPFFTWFCVTISCLLFHTLFHLEVFTLTYVGTAFASFYFPILSLVAQAVLEKHFRLGQLMRRYANFDPGSSTIWNWGLERELLGENSHQTREFGSGYYRWIWSTIKIWFNANSNTVEPIDESAQSARRDRDIESISTQVAFPSGQNPTTTTATLARDLERWQRDYSHLIHSDLVERLNHGRSFSQCLTVILAVSLPLCAYLQQWCFTQVRGGSKPAALRGVTHNNRYSTYNWVLFLSLGLEAAMWLVNGVMHYQASRVSSLIHRPAMVRAQYHLYHLLSARRKEQMIGGVRRLKMADQMALLSLPPGDPRRFGLRYWGHGLIISMKTFSNIIIQFANLWIIFNTRD